MLIIKYTNSIDFWVGVPSGTLTQKNTRTLFNIQRLVPVGMLKIRWYYNPPLFGFLDYIRLQRCTEIKYKTITVSMTITIFN